MYDEDLEYFYSVRNGRLFFYKKRFKLAQIDYLAWEKNIDAYERMKEDFSSDERRLSAHPLQWKFKKLIWTAYLFWGDRLLYVPLDHGVCYLLGIVPNHAYDQAENNLRFTKEMYDVLQEHARELLLKYLSNK